MKLRNSVSNELRTTVGRTTIKMNAHFVPRFFSFVCRQRTLRTLACKVRLLARMLVPPLFRATIHDPRSTVFSKSAKPLDLQQKFTTHALDPKTYSLASFYELLITPQK